LAAADSLAANLTTSRVYGPGHCYRVGDAFLSVRADDLPFLERFSLLFGGCGVPGADAGFPLIEARVIVGPPGIGGVLVTVGGTSVSDPAGLVEALFADDGVHRNGQSRGWDGFASRDDPGWQMAVRGADLVISREAPWPHVAGAVLVHRAMCADPDVLFVHAAAVRIGRAGVLFVGPTGAGKTTVAVGLAARGHGLLSDEVGAIRLKGPAVVPFPRAAGVRPGPRAGAASAMIDRPGLPIERFADGSTKTLVPLDAFGPSVRLGEPTPLRHVVVLDGRSERARLTTLSATTRHAKLLAPVKSTPFSVQSALKTMRLIALTSGVEWHRLTAGDPDETLTLIEQRFGDT